MDLEVLERSTSALEDRSRVTGKVTVGMDLGDTYSYA